MKRRIFIRIRSTSRFRRLSDQAIAPGNTLTELQSGWRMSSANAAAADGSIVSQSGFDAAKWYPIARMPATVLQTLVDNGVYKDVYQGTNLATEVPQDLWKQDWWYRTTFTAPAGRDVYSLIFKGINYRGDIWLNGHQIADRSKVVGMYASFEFDVSRYIRPGEENVLAVKVTPEQKLQDVRDRSESLPISWLDWINWKYIGYHDPEKKVDSPVRAGPQCWRVETSLPQCDWQGVGAQSVCGYRSAFARRLARRRLPCIATCATAAPRLLAGPCVGEIPRPGKPAISFQKAVTVPANQTSEFKLWTLPDVPAFSVSNPDLWWPYTWGQPNLYKLTVDFKIGDQVSDSKTINFGIRKITQHRDSDNAFPKIGKGGNFYLQVNGKDYLIRGAVYTPDLLFKNDPQRDAAMMLYVKDLGLNLLRWELKIADDTMIDRADRKACRSCLAGCVADSGKSGITGLPKINGWRARVCAARLRELRSHPSVVLWANGSDGLPPDPVLNDYHGILDELHWQNAVVDTVSHFNRTWSGIHMAGPYVWHPPSYWFSEKYAPARGSSAEEGDNEIIPPLESLKKFIPADKLWPINDTWYFHAGGNEGNNTLNVIRKAVEQRYGLIE